MATKEQRVNPFRSPWRVMGLIIAAPLAAVLVGITIQITAPEVYKNEYTDTGVLIFDTAPVRHQ